MADDPAHRDADLAAWLDGQRRLVDRALDAFVPGERIVPAQVHRAMRHSLFAGGKRLRPILALAAAEACGGTAEGALPAACAVECIHTFSLIHDDLPCMDDDDFRRGVPTCHKVFGEAVAVLAGDALQALAFEILCAAAPTRRYGTRELVLELAVASGSRQLVGGQVLDLDAEGGAPDRRALRAIHERKTAALLAAAVRLGAMSADATPRRLDALTVFGSALGLAFQVIDDILDVTQTSEKLGKTAGKDEAAGKATFPAVIGLDASRREAARLTRRAVGALEPLGRRAGTLRALAGRLLERDY